MLIYLSATTAVAGRSRWGVAQTESARNRLKRILRGSDRRSEQVGSGVDQWTTPRRIFLLAAGPDLGGSPRFGGPPRLSGAVAVGDWGGDDDTYFKKKNRWSNADSFHVLDFALGSVRSVSAALLLLVAAVVARRVRRPRQPHAPMPISEEESSKDDEKAVRTQAV